MKLLISFILLGCVFGVKAQQSVSASGGSFSNVNLSVNYTIGECVTETFSSGNTKLTQGFQQPSYKIATISKMIESGFVVQTYPNPVSNNLVLSVSEVKDKKITYKVFGTNGTLISAGKVTTSKSEIDFGSLPVSTYILRVFENNKEIESFKIVKQ